MGGWTSRTHTVQHSDNDYEVELTRVSQLEKNADSEQNIKELQHHIECLTRKIQQLEVKETRGEERIERVEERMSHGEERMSLGEKRNEELEKEVVDLKAESENKKRELAALTTDNKDLRAELGRKSTNTNISIGYAKAVHASDTATVAKTMNTYTSSEMLVDNSQTFNSTEEHISVNENTETRTDNTDQIPKPRPDWKL